MAPPPRAGFGPSTLTAGGGTGYDLMAEMKARQDLPGIALTGYGMEGDIGQSQRAGFRVHLAKPVVVQALDKALAAVAGPV